MQRPWLTPYCLLIELSQQNLEQFSLLFQERLLFDRKLAELRVCLSQPERSFLISLEQANGFGLLLGERLMQSGG